VGDGEVGEALKINDEVGGGHFNEDEEEEEEEEEPQEYILKTGKKGGGGGGLYRGRVQEWARRGVMD